MNTKCWLCFYTEPKILHLPVSTAVSSIQPHIAIHTCTVHFAAGLSAYVCGAFQHTLQNTSDRDWCFCLLFDGMSFREYVSVYIRSSTVLGIWRTLQQREHSILQIMLEYDDVNNQQNATTFSFINLFNSALHVLGDKFTILRSTF